MPQLPEQKTLCLEVETKLMVGGWVCKPIALFSFKQYVNIFQNVRNIP